MVEGENGMLAGTTEYFIKQITIEQLLSHYHPEEVEGYCKSCPKYDKIWSCPPYVTDVLTPLKSYDTILILGVETKDFGLTKKAIAEAMNDIASKMPVGVLIAGNCAVCKPCTKVEGAPCAYPDQMKYSLESLGFHVSDICEHVLNKPLVWDNDNPSYLAVAGIMYCQDDADESFILTLAQMLERYGINTEL